MMTTGIQSGSATTGIGGPCVLDGLHQRCAVKGVAGGNRYAVRVERPRRSDSCGFVAGGVNEAHCSVFMHIGGVVLGYGVIEAVGGGRVGTGDLSDQSSMTLRRASSRSDRW